MDMSERVARINALARKKRTEGLTDEEAAEQQQLRSEYLHEFRNGMEEMLESIIVEQPDGTQQPLKKKDK